MAIIEQLRERIEQAISKYFILNANLSQERLMSIDKIRTILSSSNPIKVKTSLMEYVENLSTGLASLWPFFEVNRFKSLIQDVLNAPQFQENEILKAIVIEMGVGLT